MPDDPILGSGGTLSRTEIKPAREDIPLSAEGKSGVENYQTVLRTRISPAIYDLSEADVSDAVGVTAKAAALGFNAVAVSSVHDEFINAANLVDLQVFLTIDLLVANSNDVVDEHPDWFASGPAGARFVYLSDTDQVVLWWDAQVARWLERGIAGFICQNAGFIPQNVFEHVIDQARLVTPQAIFIAVTSGATPSKILGLRRCGIDFCTSSSCWWNFLDGWLNDESDRLRHLAPAMALTVPPKQPFPESQDIRRRALALGAIFGAGWMMPSGFEQGHQFELSSYISDLNHLRRIERDLQSENSASVISFPGSDVAWLKRGANFALAVNPSDIAEVKFRLAPYASRLSESGAAYSSFDDGMSIEIDSAMALPPAGTCLIRLTPENPIRIQKNESPDVYGRRIAIETITPKVDDGTFPVRRIVGETIAVEADIITDGHDKLAAEILFKPMTDTQWQSRPMTLLGNDRWHGEISLTRLGRYVYAVRAWKDEYATFLDEIKKKFSAGIDIHLELAEGIALIKETAEANVNGVGNSLSEILEKVAQASLQDQRTELLDERTADLMWRGDIKKFATLSGEVVVDAERLGARFSSWYEIFPRSQSGEGDRHGTFHDVITQLPRISEMGFDVLYFPPIHPIGEKNRKGANNKLTASPTDPGSPYAIGNAYGGHDAIHPELGTFEDFRELIAAAASYGIELALDFAIQCAPDHPWLAQHKEWFDWRPDGSLRYAENPPKKYEDIVNVDFYAPGAKPSLWLALRDIVQFWVDQGIKLFRVDNPHTKPLPFWEWLINDIRGRHPDVLFLAEAFTRPKMMYRLAKIGFSQSYTYFTWRNTKTELQEYLTELSTTAPKDFFRPHFFVNTPDINPIFLHHSGRAGFLIRMALAATLSGLLGVYNGFELCEAAAVHGKEEYLDSEKYQIRVWDYDAPGNIVPEITKLNRIRRANTALQSHLGIEFHNAADDQVIFFSKLASDGNAVLVAINLDPFNSRTTTIELPLWRFGLLDNSELPAEDLMRDYKFTWQGKYQTVTLHPDQPFCIWRVKIQRDGAS